MTKGTLGEIFGEGNVPFSLEDFELQHVCVGNEFCEAFGIVHRFKPNFEEELSVGGDEKGTSSRKGTT
ncbi:hypothetical protein AX14_009952 [Amanita brunnescens Koide BX004]|nr:hypothetical protein AX14_009952 [Amanita brunnescens Koide BX004]